MTSRQNLSVRGSVCRGEFRLAVDLTVGAGEVLALLGPNGAGKSTLMQVVAGLVALDDGEISLGSTVLDRGDGSVFVPPQDRRVGVVFQDHRLFPHLRVIDNVAFGPRSRGVPRTRARQTAHAWLERLGVAEFGRRYPRELSGGQAQRVALARALACEPAALLLDEPLAALDVQTRAEVQGELRHRLAEFAGPVVIVTHDPVEALLLARRIAVLERGSIVQQGSPAAITSRPLTPYVAKLVGINLYRGSAVGGVVALEGGGALTVTDVADGEVLVALRPSAITLHPEQPPASSARNVWRANIASLVPLGDRVRVTAIGQQRSLVDLSAAAVAELELAPGRQIWLSVKATDAAAYPPASG